MLIECQMFKYSNDPIFKCSNVPMFECVFLFIGSQDFLIHWSIGQLVNWSIGPLVHWSIALVECQMSKVNKVKLLSERTSGVLPVMFTFFITLIIYVSSTSVCFLVFEHYDERTDSVTVLVQPKVQSSNVLGFCSNLWQVL